jgi:multidrug resistance efflux pump
MQSFSKPSLTHEEKRMSNDVNMAKQVIHDKFESQIKTAEAKLDTLKARAEATKANVEIRAISELLPKKQVIQQKLQQLKKSGGDQWAQAKADLEGRIADFEKSLKGIESKAKAR